MCIEESCAVFLELQEYEKMGITIWLEELQSTPAEIVQACIVREETNYMRDYVSNESGKIVELHFHRVNYS